MKIRAITIIMLALFLLSSVMIVFPVSGHSGVSLSAWTSIPPTIDGIIDTAVEWGTADTQSFTIDMGYGVYTGTLYVMNNDINLYLAVEIADDDFDTTDQVWFLFDNDHNGALEDGDDSLYVYGSSIFEDRWRNTRDGTYTDLDTDYGGTNDGSGAASTSVGINFFELSHPLDSMDDTHDFSLSLCDSVGFALAYADAGTYKGIWPPYPGAASHWHDINIACKGVYIKADGSIDPSTAPISSADNITYTFTNNLYYPIIVERDNIVVDGVGYTVRGTGTGIGMNLTGTSNVTIKNIEIKAFQHGIWVYHPYQSSNTKIIGNTITNNTYGVWIFASNNSLSRNTITDNSNSGIVVDLDSSNNTISENNITDNNRGIWLIMASGTNFHHNNMFNTQQVFISGVGYANIWDNGVEGNYWSDYAGVDLEPDGIGDSDYEIDMDNVDQYPLMGMFSRFNTSIGDYVNVISNSTIEGFQYFQSNSTIKMYVSAPVCTGFCRVCISHTLIDPEEISVIIDDGLTPVLYPNYTLYDNGSHRWVYFAYEHSTHEVDIIPEFPLLSILPLFVIATLLAVTVYRKKRYMPR